MEACSFDEANVVLSRPPDMTADDCDPLSVWRGNDTAGNPRVISCFKLTREELDLINKTGRVWLWVSGYTMPPVCLTIAHPFKENPDVT